MIINFLIANATATSTATFVGFIETIKGNIFAIWPPIVGLGCILVGCLLGWRLTKWWFK